MLLKCLVCMLICITVITIAALSDSYSSSAIFQIHAFTCDQDLFDDANEGSSLDLLTSTSLCLSSPIDLKCIGVRCNSSSTNCRIIHRPIDSVHCLRKLGNSQETLFLMENVISQNAALTMIDLNMGRLVPISNAEAVPISATPISSQRLHTQFGSDILLCSETTKECQAWTAETNQWNAFPPLSEDHIEGSMSLIGEKPIVIGGKFNGIDVNHGTVEIYDKNKKQWMLGPILVPIRRTHTALVLNETSLLVIGGYNGMILNSVKILNIIAMDWKDLDDLPIGTYAGVCGVLNLIYIVCIGGEQPDGVTGTAYALNMSLMNPEWERKSLFDTEEPIRDGFIFQSEALMFSMTLRTTNSGAARTLRRMNLTIDTPVWEVIATYPESSFTHVSPYITNGFIIHP
ncbi:uncharacterized protein LOC131891757 [Tigriopus californicus]|uniref:uncharacterized protein LOC131891757 n=1 Tax=Tigriopus californicus TaxID=6832 RepID=UPI0027DA564E|nr:uncharacterized protein LOC131891757 [Tigriopus californicus]